MHDQAATNDRKKLILVVGAIVALLVIAVILFLIFRGDGDSPAGTNGDKGTIADTHEQLMTQSIAIVKDVNLLLAGITDKQSAEEARDKLVEFNNQLKDLTARSDALGKPDAEKRAELEALPGYADTMAKLKVEFVRLTDHPDALQVVLEALPELDTKQEDAE